MMYVNITGLGPNVPSCPSDWGWTSTISYPSTSILFAIFSVTCLIFSIIIAFKYNSVTVFNKKIRTQSISNTMWIVYFITLCLRSVTNTVRYAMDRRSEAQIDWIFFLASLILHGITAFALSLALNHQRKYRSSAPQSPPPNAPPRETDSLLAHKSVSWVVNNVTITEIIFFVLFVIYLVGLYLELMNQSATFFYLFLGAFILQRLPIIILVFMIILAHNDGPSRQCKALLAVGAVLNIANDLPLFVWAQLLPQTCVFVIGSWVDFVHVMNFVSLLLFFLFLRSEYLRNMEECMWNTVSQIQDTFDFRRF
eukprot:TRINITY_DN3104_c0_g1_i1.p1 TRINITY_DN3104_c0_g1~~TRINITY_DN3104_c0_g1_i1.p1  ORF type:complete len:310 (+),score=51.41 TRINITY_DN3104_c0_g1_i1:153-1082(+)